MSVGATRYGIHFSVGGEAQPDAAPATPMPTSFRKSRRSKTIRALIASLLVVTDDAIHRGRVLRVVHVLPVAGDAPAHLERRILVHDLHGLDRPVTVLALDPGPDVPLVVELDVRRELVDLDPRHLLAALEVAGELDDLRPVGARQLVAAHAGADRRKVGDRRLVGAVVTVEAVHAEGVGMDLMAEMDRLGGPRAVPER